MFLFWSKKSTKLLLLVFFYLHHACSQLGVTKKLQQTNRHVYTQDCILLNQSVTTSSKNQSTPGLHHFFTVLEDYAELAAGAMPFKIKRHALKFVVLCSSECLTFHVGRQSSLSFRTVFKFQLRITALASVRHIPFSTTLSKGVCVMVMCGSGYEIGQIRGGKKRSSTRDYFVCVQK